MNIVLSSQTRDGRYLLYREGFHMLMRYIVLLVGLLVSSSVNCSAAKINQRYLQETDAADLKEMRQVYQVELTELKAKLKHILNCPVQQCPVCKYYFPATQKKSRELEDIIAAIDYALANPIKRDVKRALRSCSKSPKKKEAERPKSPERKEPEFAASESSFVMVDEPFVGTRHRGRAFEGLGLGLGLSPSEFGYKKRGRVEESDDHQDQDDQGFLQDRSSLDDDNVSDEDEEIIELKRSTKKIKGPKKSAKPNVSKNSVMKYGVPEDFYEEVCKGTGNKEFDMSKYRGTYPTYKKRWLKEKYTVDECRDFYKRGMKILEDILADIPQDFYEAVCKGTGNREFDMKKYGETYPIYEKRWLEEGRTKLQCRSFCKRGMEILEGEYGRDDEYVYWPRTCAPQKHGIKSREHEEIIRKLKR